MNYLIAFQAAVCVLIALIYCLRKMAEKPTFASVTGTQCTCHYLLRAADDPANPIIFDERTGEYQFTYSEDGSESKAMLVIYHCPFCGGAAPRSKRHLLFEVIPRDEEQRLAGLLKPIATIREAIEALGNPDFADYSTTRKAERDGSPPVTSFQRELRYSGLSDVAVVCISEGRDGKAYWQLQGKPVIRVYGG